MKWIISRNDLGTDMPPMYVSVASGGGDVHWVETIADAKDFPSEEAANTWATQHLGPKHSAQITLYKPE